MRNIRNACVLTVFLVYITFILILFSQSTITDSTGRTTSSSLFSSSFFCDKTRHPLLTFYGHESLLQYPEAFHPSSIKITPLNYNFTINSPPACPATSRNPTLFILILTQHEHYTQRKAIRETWGRIARNQPWPGRRLLGEVRLIFLLGQIDNVELNKEVESEANLHKDIVEANFKDSYFNLTYKVLMGMKWVQTYCPNTKYVMKMDEDSFVDIPRLLDILVSVSVENGIYGPYSHSEKVVRPSLTGESSKGSVSFEAYYPEWYPPHVKGNFYIMPYPLAMNILNVSEYFTYVNIEDAYITGVLAKVFDARHMEIIQYDKFPEFDIDLCDFVFERRIASQKIHPELLYNMWQRIEKTELCGVVRVEKVFKQFDISRYIPKLPRINQTLSEDNQNISKDNQHISTDNQHISTDNQHISAGNQHISAGNQHISTDNQHISAGNQHISAGNQNPSINNKTPPKSIRGHRVSSTRVLSFKSMPRNGA